MKRSHILLLSLLLFSLFRTEINAQQSSSPKKSSLNNGEPFVKEFDAKNLNELKLSNKHGYIDLSCWDEEKVSIEVIVNIETASSYEADEILNLISFSSRTYSKTLDYKTIFSDDFFSNYPFTINYNVKVPRRLNIKASNTIGDIRMTDIKGSLKLTHSYGNLELNNIALDKENLLNLSFVEGAIDSIGSVEANFSNCTLNLANSRSLKGKTNYCMASFTNVKNINLKSFTDRLIVTNTDSLTLKGSHFIGKVDHLNTYGFCELEKGQLLVDVSESIKELTISNNKVETTIVIPHAISYVLNGEVYNGTFTHPTPQNLQLFKEDHTVTFSGKIGSDSEPKANLILFNKDSSITIKN